MPPCEGLGKIDWYFINDRSDSDLITDDDSSSEYETEEDLDEPEDVHAQTEENENVLLWAELPFAEYSEDEENIDDILWKELLSRFIYYFDE